VSAAVSGTYVYVQGQYLCYDEVEIADTTKVVDDDPFSSFYDDDDDDDDDAHLADFTSMPGQEGQAPQGPHQDVFIAWCVHNGVLFVFA
jgi:hypothetical protein